MPVVISHEYKCIFIHIPKNAGISICNALKSEQYHHKRLFHCPQIYIQKYFKFTIVRNPWDRFVSVFNYFATGGRGLGFDLDSQQIILRYKSFSDFVLDFDNVKHEFRAPHFLPQISWTHDKNSESLLDFIGCYENINDDFARICEILEIDNIELPWLNKFHHKNYKEYYNEKTVDFIGREYEGDIKTYGYRF